MALKAYKPTTPGQRGLILIDRRGLYKGGPEKQLTEGLKSTGGRNNLGRVTVRHRGGGHKRRYRVIDFKRNKTGMEAVVERIEYDPNRTAFIALVQYTDGEKRYIIAPQRLSPGDTIISGAKVDPVVGNAMELSNMPVGTIIHNVELKPGKGGEIARSAGSYAQIVGRDQGYVLVKLVSGELRRILGRCFATVGSVSNPDQKNINLGKAGRSRWLGRRPKVRGVAMNPFDHPHGGGEGKTSGGRHPVSPKGVPTKGKRTRSNKVTDKYILRRRSTRRGRAGR